MKKKYICFLSICLSLILLLAACNDQSSNDTEQGDSDDGDGTSNNGEVVLEIPSYRSGQNVGAKFFLPQVERFNEKYEGKYEVVIEEIPQADYNDKIKLLAQQEQLPALIQGGDINFINDVVVENELYYDLKPWLDSKPEIKEMLIDDSVAYNTTEDGKIVSFPFIVMRPIGLYYNKELFDNAGITKEIGEMSFEEFNQALETIKDSGTTPLTLMTGENAWTTALLATAFLADQPGGVEVLKSPERVYDYTDKMWVNTFAEIQQWFQKGYTTENAIGAAYADAANNFLNERTSIIANGPWMVADFSDTSKAADGLEERIGSSIYPGGIALASLNEYNWWIPKGLEEEETEAALAFLEFIHTPEELEAFMVAEGGTAPNMETSADFDSKLDPILLELNQSIDNNMNETVQPLTSIFPTQIAETEFGKFLPLLADGSVTPEEFAEELTSKAQQFKD